jgi:FkbM family methyltransferase
MLMRRLIEQWARCKTLRRRLPPDFGRRPIFVSPDSALTYLLPRWSSGSQQLLSVARRFVTRGSTVWDIGANVGIFAFAAAARAGAGAEVMAVEPDPFLASLLQRSASHPANADIAVAVLCAAVSDQRGLARFLIASRGRSSNALEQSSQRSQAGGTRYVQYTPTITLDSLLETFKSPHFVKIDVEGAEVLVLEGAEKVMSHSRPIFYVEVGSEQRASVTELFTRHGYRLYDGDSEDVRELQSCTWNTLAVPKESMLTNRGVPNGGANAR